MAACAVAYATSIARRLLRTAPAINEVIGNIIGIKKPRMAAYQKYLATGLVASKYRQSMPAMTKTNVAAIAKICHLRFRPEKALRTFRGNVKQKSLIKIRSDRESPPFQMPPSAHPPSGGRSRLPWPIRVHIFYMPSQHSDSSAGQ